MRVGTKGRSGKTRSSPNHENSKSPSMHFNSSYVKSDRDSSARREFYSPQNVYKSQSPQLSSSYNEDPYIIKTSREVYSSPRLISPTQHLASPARELYSPKLVDEQQHGYSTVYKSEFHKDIRHSQSPVYDYSNRDSTDFYAKKNVSKTNLTTRDEGLYSSSYVSKIRNENSYMRKSDSPTLLSSPINVRCSQFSRIPLMCQFFLDEVESNYTKSFDCQRNKT